MSLEHVPAIDPGLLGPDFLGCQLRIDGHNDTLISMATRVEGGVSCAEILNIPELPPLVSRVSAEVWVFRSFSFAFLLVTT